MFAPLVFVFGLSAGINRMSAAAAQLAFYAFAAVMGVSISSIFLVFTGRIDRAGLPDHRHRLRGPVPLRLHHEAGHVRMGTFLIMGVIGLIVAMVVNILLASPASFVRGLGDRRADLRRPDRL